jgi:hypothetical protein
MTKLINYDVEVVTVRDNISDTRTVSVLAYNTRQAERKAVNQSLNRSTRLLSAHAKAA